MSIVGSITIETQKVRILPKNRQSIQIANKIASSLQQLGLDAKVQNISLNVTQGVKIPGYPDELYLIDVPVSAGMSHRAIIDILRGFGWVNGNFEAELMRAEKEYKIASATKEKASVAQKDFIANYIEPYVEKIIEKCKDRITAFNILVLAIATNGAPDYLVQEIKQQEAGLKITTKAEIAEIIELLKILGEVCFRSEKLLPTFNRLGGFLPSETKIRDSYLSQIEKQLTEVFGDDKGYSIKEKRQVHIQKGFFKEGMLAYGGMLMPPQLFGKLHKEAEKLFPESAVRDEKAPDAKKTDSQPPKATPAMISNIANSDRGDAKMVANSVAIAPNQVFFQDPNTSARQNEPLGPPPSYEEAMQRPLDLWVAAKDKYDQNPALYSSIFGLSTIGFMLDRMRVVSQQAEQEIVRFFGDIAELNENSPAKGAKIKELLPILAVNEPGFNKNLANIAKQKHLMASSKFAEEILSSANKLSATSSRDSSPRWH